MYFYFMSSDKWKNVINPRYHVGINIAFSCSLWHDGLVLVRNVHDGGTSRCEFVHLSVNITSAVEQITKNFDLFLWFDIRNIWKT